MKDVDVTDKAPEDLSSYLHVCACYLEVDGKILLLQQPSHKSDPGCWGVPGGKLEKGESPEDAAIRELFEETGISILPSQVEPVTVLYLRKPEIQFVFHMFRIHVTQVSEVRISNEHQGYMWVEKEALKTFPLMRGALQCLEYFYDTVR